MTPPEYNLKLLCTPKLASTCHLQIPRSLYLSTTCRFFVKRRYLTRRLHSSQSLLFGECTRPENMLIVGVISGLDLEGKNIPFATTLWNNYRSWPIDNSPPPISKRSIEAGVSTKLYSLNFSDHVSIMSNT